MKRLLAAIGLLFFLVGCGNSDGMDSVLEFRRQLLSGEGCGFTAEITADYGESLYTFSMDCTGDKEGNVAFTVTKPESIAGITGTLSHDGGKLTFDGEALAFPMLAEGQLTPISGTYIFLKTLRGGYLKAAGEDGDNIRISLDDSYEADALHLDIWMNKQMQPVRAEILWQGRRSLSLSVSNFKIL